MRCLVVTAFLNEEQLLPVFLESLERQTRGPDRLVLCDDGSTDGSDAQAVEFARTRDWVTALRRPPRPLGEDRLHGAPELLAFLWALDQVDEPWDVVVKMDADLQLAPRHFETVLDALAADPALGMAGTYLVAERVDGTIQHERHPESHVRGPTRFYRRECFEDVSPIPTALGWDSGDVVRARTKGWRTRSVQLEGEQSVHLRPTGTHDGRLRAHARWGLCQYSVGAHPLIVVAGAALRWRNPPRGLSGLAYVYGWAAAALGDADHMPDDIRRARRREDRIRLRAIAARVLRA